MAVPAKRDLLRMCLFGTIVLSVSQANQQFGLLAKMRPALTLVAIALVAAFVNPKALATNGWQRRWPAKLLLAITLWTMGSIVFGISQGQAFWFFVDQFSKTLGCAVLMMAAIRDPRDLWRLVWAYVVGSAILVWSAMFVYQLEAGMNGTQRLGGLDTWDSNDLCVVLLLGLGLCLLLIRTSKTRGKVCATVIAVGIAASIARSGSRGGFVGLGAFAVAYLFSLKGTSVMKRVIMVVVLAAGLVFEAPTGYWQQMQTIGSKDDYNETAAQGRKQLAKRGIGYMLKYPVFGLGISNFGRAEGTISSVAGQDHIRWSAAHNTYVEAGAELGIPGFVLFLTMVVGSVIVPWRLRRRIPASWQTGDWDQQFLFHTAVYLPVAAIGFAVPAYFVSFAWVDMAYILLAMTSGLIACVNERLGDTSAAPRGNGRLSRIPRGRGASGPLASRPINNGYQPAAQIQPYNHQ